MILSFLLGTINAVDQPARQAFVSELVTDEKVHSAIALNASIFNAARVVGPGVAGILIALVGVGGAFLLNALSYVAAIIVQFLIIPIIHHVPEHPHPLQAVKEGISYTWHHPIVRSLILLTAVISIFGWSYTTIMPYIAENVFHQDAAGLGYLYAAAGLGALLATILLSGIGTKFRAPVFIIGGCILFAIFTFLLSYTTNLYFAYVYLFLGNFGLLMVVPVVNAQIQNRVAPHFRGRVISIYLLMFVGLFPVGSLQIGFLAEHLGVQMALRIGAIAVLIAGILCFIFKSRISRENEEYLSKNIHTKVIKNE
jgi:predicted MFS family arabinose efflux permease